MMDYINGVFETMKSVYKAYMDGDIHPMIVWEYFVHRIRSTFSSTFETGVVVRHSHSDHLLYYDNEKKYRIILPKKRNFRKIVEAYDQEGRDITDLIMEVLGPRNDFHGSKVTPNYLGCETVKIVYRDDTEREYHNNDLILPSPLHSYERNDE